MRDFDSEIREALHDKTKDITPSDDLPDRIRNRLYEEKKTNVKNFRFTAKFAAAAVFTLILGSAVIGAGKIAVRQVITSPDSEIKHFPTQDEVNDTVGYNVKFTQKLGNYDFESAFPADSEDKDEIGNILNSFRGICFRYKTDKGTLGLNAQPAYGDDSEVHYDEITKYNGISIYYDSFTYKAVPPDYVKTAEDIAREKKGELQIASGTDSVYEKSVQSVSWTDNNIKYSIVEIGTDVEKNELTDMAAQLIDVK